LRRSRLPAVLGSIEGALLIDAIFSVRWRIHDLLKDEATSLDLYSERSAPQVIALVLIAVAAGVVVAIVLWRLRGRPSAGLAVGGVIVSLTCWIIEVISLHAVDALLYRTVHGVMRVSIVWIAASLMTGVGILMNMKQGAS
jgi:hypothetical protein